MPDATPNRGGGLSSFATSRPVAVTVVFLAAVVFGFLSYFRLPVTLMPEMSYPTLTVRTEYPGAAPEEVENEISRPVEEALGVIGGLQRVSSVSRAGVSDVVLEFGWDTAMSDAVQDTLEKLDQVLLPDDAERPLVLRFDPSLDPVMELSLTGVGDRYQGEEGLRRLRRIAELQIKREIEPIKGVAAVQVRGGLEEEIQVLLDQRELERTGLSIDQVIQRLSQENINLAGGTLKEGTTEYMVRTLNEYQTLEQIGETVLLRQHGREVRLRDLGQVIRGHKDRQMVTHGGGAESVQLDVFKEADANMVALARRVRDALGSWEDGERDTEGADGAEGQGAAATSGGGKGKGNGQGGEKLAFAAELYRNENAKLEVVADRSLFIAASIKELRETALLGGILAVCVLFLFLGSVRTTAIIAVAIPASLLVTFAPLNIFGISLNIMSLGGLALGIGMLVDSSIVVLESIFRCREEGDDLVTSVVRGTEEVRGAVIASTLTSIAVFFPMVFVEGVAGQAFGDLGLAVIVSLLASLIVALYLIPMLAARRGIEFKGGASEHHWLSFRSWGNLVDDCRGLRGLGWLALFYLAPRFAVAAIFEVVGMILAISAGILLFILGGLVKLLAPIGTWLMKFPLGLMERGLAKTQSVYSRLLSGALDHPSRVGVLVVVCLVLTVWTYQRLETELLPEVHQGEVTFELALPPGTPLEQTLEALEPIEAALLEEVDNIDSLLVSFGFDPAQSQRSDEGEHTAQFKVILKDADAATEEATVRRIRERLAAVPDLDQRVERPVLFSFKTPIEVEVHGEDLGQLKAYAEKVQSRLAAMPELTDVQTTLKSGAPEVEILYDRELLSRYGLNLGLVAQSVRSMVRGDEATLFNMENRRIPIVVRLGEDDRRTVEDIRNLTVNPGGEAPIALSAVATVQLGEGPSEVRRIDGRRVALVRANLGQGSLGAAVGRIREELIENVEWPADMTFLVAGQQEEWERSSVSLGLALALSIFLVYVIMAAQFESLLYPFIILFTIPLAFLGTGWALLASGTSLSIVVVLGMIMLAGIVVNNAIVLVDYANLLKERGMDRWEAVRTAGEVRLRPILMTTATTVLGLLPMAFATSEGAELRTPMALAVISGLVVSTLLTLIVIPTLYALLDSVKERVLGGATAEAEGTDDGLLDEDLQGLPEPGGAAS
ncbi:MAG: efflux RND transporter permease subunit [Thermoanaerobaculia bacterium]|nr:efflux RND transporter permease subunit [Thermoanaerobaculia bacterium]